MPLEPTLTIVEESDRSLVERVVAESSEPAFRTLYRRHSPRLYRMAIRIVGSETDAEDILQETWYRAVPRLESFEWRSALGTWLGAIVINLSRDLLDRRGRWSMIDLDSEVLRLEPRSSGFGVDLERALATLPTGSRTVFLLHDLEGYTHDEIGALLGCDPGTSKSQLFRARRALRRLLSQPEVEGTRNGT